MRTEKLSLEEKIGIVIIIICMSVLLYVTVGRGDRIINEFYKIEDYVKTLENKIELQERVIKIQKKTINDLEGK